MFFNPGPVTSWDDVTKSDVETYKTYFHSMLEQGVYIAPSAFEAAFVSTAHSPQDLELTLAAARKAMARN
jgi:glutamate-1-semialdehyde 2,1-aminomutase